MAGAMNTNPDGTSNLMGRLPLAQTDKNMLSAIGSIEGASNSGFKAASAGLALDNINGHSASVTGRHIPGFGNQLTGAGKVSLVQDGRHDLSANAFATKTFPNHPAIPNFNTVGGGVDYMHKGQVGASVGVAHTNLLKQTDYSAMGKVNLFQNPTSSLDLHAGATKSVSPFIPKSNWQPSGGLTFTKRF